MTTLTKKLQEIRERHSAQYGHEQAQILELSSQLRAQDERLIADLDDVLEGHEQRRSIIHRKILTVAQCVGLLPPAAPVHQPEPVAIDGADVSTAEELARRFRPQIANGHGQAH